MGCGSHGSAVGIGLSTSCGSHGSTVGIATVYRLDESGAGVPVTVR
jgi:hypothetical protein